MHAKRRRGVLALLLVGLLLAAGLALAVASGDLADSLAIPWWTADSGGGRSSGGSYSLQGTAGQPDAGRSSGGDYALVGGFWAGPLEPAAIELFMPVVTK